MAEQPLEIRLERVENVQVVSLEGIIDASTFDDVRRVVEPLCEQEKPRVLVDCSNLHYINSTGYGFFFAMLRECKSREGLFALCSVRNRVRNILKGLGIEKYFAIHPSQAEALAIMANS